MEKIIIEVRQNPLTKIKIKTFGKNHEKNIFIIFDNFII